MTEENRGAAVAPGLLAGIDAGSLVEWVDFVRRGLITRDKHDLMLVSDLPRAIANHGAELRTQLAASEERRKELREALSSIQRYGLDTLSGRVNGPDDRAWQRGAVNEMTKRAQAALANDAEPKGGAV